MDHLAAANWMFACVNSEEGDQPEPPAPVPRPSYDEEASPAEPAPEPDPAPTDSAPSAVQLAHFFG